MCACIGAFLSIGAASAQFRHPGLLHTEEDFARTKQRIADGETVAVQSLELLRNAYPIKGDHGNNWAVNEYIKRGVSGDENYMNAYRNAARAYQAALIWKITGEEWYGNIAIDVLDAYRTWNKGLGGNSNISLIPGFIGYQLLNAAEIMRDYEKWPAENIRLFRQYMIDVWFTVAQDFLERRHDTVAREGNWIHYHSNWGTGNALFCVSLGVFADAPDIYNYGMEWLTNGPGNESLFVTDNCPYPGSTTVSGYGWGLIPWFHEDERGPLGYFCQMSECGRDQGHAMAALATAGYALQVAYNQGDNAFCNLRNPLVPGLAGSAMLAGGAEYVAAYNAGVDDLPYTQNWWMGAMNATGRGQLRPIWQMFINHYQNRMGIPMKYCLQMKEKVGIEQGGGAYGVNSGGFDQTGWGDLLYSDEPVAEGMAPSILFPTVKVGDGEDVYRPMASGVEPGTTVTFSASLSDGETDTGKWVWDDGVAGRSRTLTVDKSGVYVLTYENEKGVKSTQSFTVAVWGDGATATLNSWINYNAENHPGTVLAMGKGRTAVISTGYANWNYIASEKWYENGVEIATGGSYTFTMEDMEEHTLVFELTTQGGGKVRRTFTLKPDPDELTYVLADPNCEDYTKWTCSTTGFQPGPAGDNYPGFDAPFIERFRFPSEGGLDWWGQDRFDIRQTVGGLQAGKYRLTANVIATQQGKGGMDSKAHVRGVYLYAGGVHTAVSSQNKAPERFTVEFYVQDGEDVVLGVKNMTDQNHAHSHCGLNWFAMDGYTLHRESDADLSADIAALRGQAGEIAEGSIPAAIYNKVKDALALSDESIATAVRLQQAVSEASVVRDFYEEFLADYDTCLFYAEKYALTDVGLSAALDDFANAATAEGFFDAHDRMRAAWIGCMPLLEGPAGAEILLQNTSMAEVSAEGYDYDTRWMTGASGGNFRVLPVDGSDAVRGEAVGENMIERWCGGNFVADERQIYQPALAAPAGKYVFRAAVQKKVDAGVMYLFANGRKTPVLTGNTLRRYEVSCEVNEGDTLDVGVMSGAGNATQWVSIADAELMYYSPLALLKEALSEAGGLDYGEDADGALAAAVVAARGVVTSGDAASRMSAYHTLREAMDAYKKENASQQHPYDVTSSVANATFDGRNVAGWELAVTDKNFPAYNRGVIEFWHTPFDLNQTLSGLQNGVYRVGMQARSDKGAGNTGFMLYAVGGGVTEEALAADKTRADGTNTSLHLGQNADELVRNPDLSRIYLTVSVTDGMLTLGARCTDNGTWCVLNDFTLEYVGSQQDEWAEWVRTANGIDRECIPSGISGVLDEALAADVDAMTAEDFAVALKALKDAVGRANAMEESYMAVKATLDHLYLMAEQSREREDGAKETFVSVLDAVENACTPETLDEAIPDLEPARQAYVLKAVPLGDMTFDMGFLVANAAGTQSGGWLTDGAGNFGPVTNDARNGEYDGGRFFEKWDISSYIFKDGKRPVYQTVGGLQKGNYTFGTAAFRYRTKDSGAAWDGDFVFNPGSLYVFLNGGQTEVTGSQLDYYAADGAVTDGVADIGLKAGADNNANWVGLADASLVFKANDLLTLDETATEIVRTSEGRFADVTLLRKLSAGKWNTFCVPFAIPAEKTKEIFSEVRMMDGVTYGSNNVTLHFTKKESVEAGMPYIVKVDADISGITLQDAYIASFDPVPLVVDGVTMVGVYENGSISNGEYFINNNAFYVADTPVRVKGYRAFITLQDAQGAGVNRLLIDWEDNTTGISAAVREEPGALVDVYTLSGVAVRKRMRRVEALDGLPRGIYLVGGRKVVK